MVISFGNCPIDTFWGFPMLKTVVLGLVLGITLGFSLASELFTHVGMQAETYMLIMCGLLLAILVVNRGIAVLATLAVLSIAVLQPDQVLLEHGFDKDLLIATLAVIFLYPIVYRVMNS